MHTRLFLFVFALSCCFLACNQFDKNSLIGHWKAIKVFEEGKEMELDINPIHFSFDKNDRYEYHRTIGYQEAGKYILTGDLLLSTDTTRTDGKEKAVKIIQLVKDSLKLEMLANDKKQTIHLVKQ